MKHLLAFAAGALFGAGLVVSGMTEPRNVIGFLDVSGRWNPRLMAVMGGAVAVHAVFLRWPGRSRKPTGAVSLAPDRPVDTRLLVGAGVFGIGWGLAGYCPGPAIVALGFGNPLVVLFFLAVAAGVVLGEAFAHRPSRADRSEVGLGSGSLSNAQRP